MGSRAGMLSGERRPTDENEGLSWARKSGIWPGLLIRRGLGRKILRRMHLISLIRVREERVRILRHQTAELWMVPDSKSGGPQPMVFACPSCSETEETRLLSVELRTDPRRFPDRSRRPRSLKNRSRILLRITRQQLEYIRADFDSTARKSRRFRSGPDNRSDREIVLGSLVP
jgi:hypothetical protein